MKRLGWVRESLKLSKTFWKVNKKIIMHLFKHKLQVIWLYLTKQIEQALATWESDLRHLFKNIRILILHKTRGTRKQPDSWQSKQKEISKQLEKRLRLNSWRQQISPFLSINSTKGCKLTVKSTNLPGKFSLALVGMKTKIPGASIIVDTTRKNLKMLVIFCKNHRHSTSTT